MARVILGMAVPHSGMLGKAPETWLEDGDRDRRNQGLIYANRSWTFEELKAARAHEHFEAMLTPAELRARGQRCAVAMDLLRQVYAQNKPDVAVLLGKDQKEIFIDVNPSLAVYTGATVENGPPQRSVYAPDKAVTHAVQQGLAQHLISSFENDGFDMMELIKWPPNTWMQNKPIVPHAYGFLYHQIMADDPPPSVPVFMNTFYAPTQPSMARSLQFGKSLYDAIQAWDSDKTVALIASGGMSHFVCDEQLDQKLLGYFRNYDFDGLINLNPMSYQSGNSEVKLYAPVLWAMKQLGAEMQLADYVPCYRTEAGTGEGCAFMYWTPPQQQLTCAAVGCTACIACSSRRRWLRAYALHRNPAAGLHPLRQPVGGNRSAGRTALRAQGRRRPRPAVEWRSGRLGRTRATAFPHRRRARRWPVPARLANLRHGQAWHCARQVVRSSRGGRTQRDVQARCR